MDQGKRTFYLGRYNCIEQLGTGPIGETFRAKIYGVAGFEKQFAVKRLHPHLSGDEAFVARFVQAASAFAALEHHGIARVHEVNAQGAHYYVVIDLVRGLDVRRLLDLLQQRGEALAPDAAMAITLQTADALDYAHSRTNLLPGGVLHLGLTAPSIMVTYEGDVKLVDVGLVAALVQPGWSDDDTLTPTLAYVAPEQWRAEPLDVRADVFSLGVVLHELLSGSRTFLSDRASELRAAIEGGPPAPPRSDPRLQEIVTRALQPDRERRFASVAEMRAAIQGILGGRFERARADLSAVVRRLAMPRERRTGAFAAVTLPPAATGMTSPVSAAKPPPIPPAARPWAPPTPRPPGGAQLSSVPVHNTLAGIGPDDQALVPIELVELPGLPTEKAMPTVAADEAERTAHADEAETARFPRADEAETRRVPRAPSSDVVPQAGATSAADAGWAELAEDAPAVPPPIPGDANAIGAGAELQREPPVIPVAASGDETPLPPALPSDLAPRPEPPLPPADSAAASGPDTSWLPTKLDQPPPSPVPTFAAPTVERPEPVERPKPSVPAMKLPSPRGGGRAVLGSVALLAAAGALAIYAGLSGGARPTAETPATPTATQPTSVAVATPDLAHVAALTSPDLATVAQLAGSQPEHAGQAGHAAQGEQVAHGEHAAQGEHGAPGAVAVQAPQAAQGDRAAQDHAGAGTHATQGDRVAQGEHPPQPAQAAPPAVGAAAGANAGGGTFEIATTPAGASVFVDGEARGETPVKLDIAPGRHKLVIAGEGQKLVQRELQATPGGHVDIALEPAKLPSEIAGDAGLKVRCKSHGEIRIFVDGSDSGRSCPNDERISVAPGPHKIGLLSARTGEMHEVEHEVVEGNNSTRVYVRY